jgi:hypothetical protein
MAGRIIGAEVAFGLDDARSEDLPADAAPQDAAEKSARDDDGVLKEELGR